MKKKVEIRCKISDYRQQNGNQLFAFRTLDFGEFLLFLAGYQNEEQDDYDELNLAFQLFDAGNTTRIILQSNFVLSIQ